MQPNIVLARRQHFTWVAFLLLLTTVVSTLRANPKHQPAPPWELKDLNGKTIRLSDFAGKVIILDFWATWCPPCREEIPGFISLQKKYGDKGLVVIGVSLDEAGPAVVKRFATQMQLNYPVVMATAEVSEKYGGNEYIPTTFVIDRHGNIIVGHQGKAEEATFESEIKPLL